MFPVSRSTYTHVWRHPIIRWETWSLVVTCILVGATGCSDRPAGTPEADRETGVARDSVAQSSDREAEPLGERDYRPVAEKVVGQNAGVREGDVVWLFGRDEDLPLLEDLAVEARKRGGAPLVTVGTERLQRRMYDEVPAKYDTVPHEGNLKLAGVVDVVIGTESGEQRTLKGVPAERMEARSRADAPFLTLMRKRGVRAVLLGNGLYPSAERAEQFDISRRDLAEMLYGGLEVDYTQLQRTGETMRQVLAAGKEVHITAPNGTDLRARIAGRPAYVSDGIISAEDRRRGGPATSVWLPAGEVYVIPVPGSAEGVLVTDQDFFRGERIEGLRLEFKQGRVTAMSAKSGLEALMAEYDAAGRGKDALGVLDFGINPGLKLPANKPIHAWSRAGMVTVAVGDNAWAGGDINAGFGIAPYLLNGTVAVDGRVVIQDGKLATSQENMAAR
jgi:aminopeptidase